MADIMPKVRNPLSNSKYSEPREDENYRVNTDLMDLLIDHNGVLIAKDHDYQTLY